MAVQFEGINKSLTSDHPDLPHNMSHSLQEEIVISGISGRLPNSANIDEFKKNLFEGVDCVTENNRWSPGIYGLPKRSGIIQDILSFDATFFGVHHKQAHIMDPQLRMLLEVTYEAIIDAGYNPISLKGTKTGVFVGISYTESEHLWSNDPELISGYILTGCSQSMFPNRISYFFDFKGPSYAIDSSCSSSAYAIHQAVVAINNGECDAAIVGGVNLSLYATFLLHFHRANMLSQDGMCKSFDADGKGYVRSDAVVAILLQKSKDAHRIYATVVQTKTSVDGYKVEGIIHPSGEMQYKLMREAYEEIGLDPINISYVEAHGIGAKTGDQEEANAITNIFCKNRKGPLLIGSVKSNIGHTESASALCAIAKILIMMENGVIPPNLHYKTPNPNIPALLDGRLEVVDKCTPWDGGLVALNSFGFSGANAHVILRSNPKKKLLPVTETKLPKLVTISGRTPDAINYMLDAVRVHKQDDEFIALLRDIHVDNIPAHLVRGYEILSDSNSREVVDYKGLKRPIWYVFSGMGSQWEGMGRQLLCIETFQRSLERCAAVLKPLGIDLMDLILNGTNEIYYNVLYCLVSIAAIQVGLVDLLTLLNIHADGIVGHSFGELGCAYADGTLTLEQVMLVAYWRGKSVLLSDSPPGAMAAVGLSWEETGRRCHSGVYPVCHNSDDSVTISGPIDAINTFVNELQYEGIFAKVVNSSGYAFHSKYIASAAPILRANLKKIIPNPKKRSSKWISSSIPESDWHKPLAQLSSTEYHVNNLLSPVLFHEAVAHIPDNAIAIEIAPHCLFQSILCRSLSQTITNIGLQKRNHKDNLGFFLSSIGKLYTAGAQPRISNLYPPVNYPVSRGTPMINSLIKWDHSTEWPMANFSYSNRAADYFIDVDLSKEKDAFIMGHTIDGRILYPAAGYILLIWKTFAKLKDMDREKMPIIFEDVHIHRETVIPVEGLVKFIINIFNGSGDFEISESGSIVITGKVRSTENVEREQLHLSPLSPSTEIEDIQLTMKDIYKEFKLRGYDYNGVFQAIKKADNRGNTGEISWSNNWISFIDSMFQFGILGNSNKELYLPIRFKYLLINPAYHIKLASELPQKNSTFPIYNYKNINCLKSGGVEMRGLKISMVSRKHQTQIAPKLERYTFVPYNTNQILADDPNKAKLHILSTLLQVVCENILDSKLNVAEIAESKSKVLLMPYVLKILHCEPIIRIIDSQLITTSPDNYTNIFDQSTVKVVVHDVNKAFVGQNWHLIIATNLLSNKSMKVLQNLSAALKDGGFIILEETNAYDKNLLNNTDLRCVATLINFEWTYVLLKKIEKSKEPIIIRISEKNFSWLEDIQKALKKAKIEGQEILLISERADVCGLIGFVNCLRFENSEINIRYFLIQDKNASKFLLTTSFYAEQLRKQMVANVLKEGQWGSYRYLRLEQRNNEPFSQVEHAFVNALIPGDLSSLRWIESSLSFYHSEKHRNTEICSVYYASLNHKDIMLASGKLLPDASSGSMVSQECILGLEYSGRDTKGRRIMGIVSARGLATTVLVDPLYTWEVPDKWTLKEAATIPFAYAISYYALFVHGHLQSGESVLIHVGSGGVGQASIALALYVGCKIFTTVESEEERNFLKKKFPQLTDRNIANSGDTSLEQLIMSETNGRGVDVILSSSLEETLQACLRCLAMDGRFLEIGKYDLSNDNNLGMSVFLKNISYHEILVDLLFGINISEKKKLAHLISEGIMNGAIQPLSMAVFSENQVMQAFRYMTTGKHIGKVLLKIREEEAQKVVAQPSPKTVMAIPRTYMNPDKSYILVGGLGGFGLELANWMIGRGAKHIVLVSRSGIRTGYQSLCVRRWREAGVNVVISTTDSTSFSGAEQLINESNKIAPVGGIFNLAVVLNDALFENLNEDHFKMVTLPKIDATKHLDAISRQHCPALDYFVVFSSVACGRGNIGQTNYGLANSAMERLVEQRKSNGLPGLAIQWGPIGDVGSSIETMGDNRKAIDGTLPQRIRSCLSTMDMFLQQLHPVVSSVVLTERYY